MDLLPANAGCGSMASLRGGAAGETETLVESGH